MKYRYLYGPVPSRRLGLSLGVDTVPLKTCTLSCVYCQIGRTPSVTVTRGEYVAVDELIGELRSFFEEGGVTDWITFSGSGEPTLNSRLGDLIHRSQEVTDAPKCVITNSTLMWLPEVRRDLLEADAVMPSLDSAVEETFRKVCRPHPEVRVDRIIDGLAAFRDEYKGKIWLEIMFLEGINDSQNELDALKAAVDRIRPDAVHLNTVARPPAESWAKPLSYERMEEIRAFFGPAAEVIACFKSKARTTSTADADEILEYLRRRPGCLDDIVTSLGIGSSEAEKMLAGLVASGAIVERIHYGKRFWESPPGDS